MLVIGIETSCDDTSFAVVEDGYKIRANIISSQTIHSKYGGVVPELASREHIKNISYVFEEGMKTANITLKDVDGIAVTNRPGLIVSLLVGLNFAKGLAYAGRIPLIGVNHTLGHIYSNHLSKSEPEFPYIGFILSGGHTILCKVHNYTTIEVIGTTRDDAIGEAFDKISKFMGFGYPGGPIIDKLSELGNPDSIKFPRPRFKDKSLDFSYSGLKTAVLNYYRKNPDTSKADIAASFQKTAIDILIINLKRYLEKENVSQLSITGGVSANSYLRKTMAAFSKKNNIKLFIPPHELCTDNAAMIAGLGTRLLEEGKKDTLKLDAYSRGLK